MSVLQNSRPIRYSYNFYQSSPVFIKAALVVLYGLKCYLSLSRRRNAGSDLLYFASYPNEHRVLDHVRGTLPESRHGEITVSVWNCFRIATFTELVAFAPMIPRLYRFAGRVVKRHDFMPACRIFSTVTYYARFKRLLDDDVGAVFVASQYSPESLGLAAAAHQSGKKVLFTNHASATGETAYVAPLHADLVAVTSQAVADLYQRHSPQALNIVPFTIGEPQQRLQMPGRDSGALTIGIYLTALTNEDRLQEIVADWSRLDAVGAVFIRPHPAEVVTADLSAVTGTRVPLEFSISNPLRGDVARSDIAVCGNSTAVIEILRGGCPVLYDHRLDYITYDYNGYLGHNLVLPHPESIDESIFDHLRAHYFDGHWDEKMRYFDSGYQQDEQEIGRQFAAAVQRVMQSGS